ncbi:isoaspartyl peptidase/L-asparaginase-like [Onthophagus taurus]|uniref:isoaspartyl peptidase/L-asparaginase-like n=1 Tax=Onthophagus taurus TaxID=166361 RepID=UPI0039BEC5E2
MKLINAILKSHTSHQKYEIKFELKKKHIIPTLIVHGGVGNNLSRLAPNKMEEVKRAAMVGYKAMTRSGSVIGGIEEAMNYMEECPEFNIGVGSMINDENEIEMDASIMDGRGLRVGAVGCAKNILHPTSLARGVMDFTPHVLISDEGIKYFAKYAKTRFLNNDLLITDLARDLFQNPYDNCDVGNAGVIAIDHDGHLAAATGNAGQPKKPAGSLTEAARVGCGIYADNNIGAVAVAGNSQHLMKFLLAFKVYKSMMYGLNPKDALKENLLYLNAKFSSNGGGIVLSKWGDVAIHYTTPQMAWAFQRGDKVYFGLNKGEMFVEKSCYNKSAY